MSRNPQVGGAPAPRSLDFPCMHNWPRPPGKALRLAYTCKSKTIVGYNQAERPAVFPLYCRRWECPDCGPRLVKKARRRLIAGEPTSFLTLTCRPQDDTTPSAQFRKLSIAINHLFKRLRRHYPGQSIEYALVWEKTRKGWPHAHLLLRAPFVPHALISHHWRKLTGSFVVDIRAVRTKGEAASYVAKYLTKNLDRPYRMKRYRTSLHYSEAPPRFPLRDYLSIVRWEKWTATAEASIAELVSRTGLTFSEYWPELWLPPPNELSRPATYG